jgi:hypothetical protein
MNVLRWGANMLENTTPVGLILAGAVLAMASPPVRRGVRSAAVMATRGVLMAAGAVQTTVAAVREDLEDVVAEAQTPADPASDAAESDCTMVKAARNHGRRLAVTAAAGALAVRDGLQGIVEEARSGQQMMVEDYVPPSVEGPGQLEPDGLDAGTGGSTAAAVSPRRRSRSKL